MAKFLTRAESRGEIHEIKISRESPHISSLMFADNLTIFCRVNIVESYVVLNCLDKFSLCSVQLINFTKSSIHVNNNVPTTTRRSIYVI